jgi:hypothetical protein
MLYTKPEIAVLGSALAVVEHGGSGEKALPLTDGQVGNLNCFVNEPDDL